MQYVINKGVGLMEIVTAPDFSSAQEASTFILDLQATLRKLGTCSANISGNSAAVIAKCRVIPADGFILIFFRGADEGGCQYFSSPTRIPFGSTFRSKKYSWNSGPTSGYW